MIALAPTEVVERVKFTLNVDEIENYRHKFGPTSYDRLSITMGPRAEVELLTDMHLGHGWVPETWHEWRGVGTHFGDDVLVVKAMHRRPAKQRRHSKRVFTRRASRSVLGAGPRHSARLQVR